MSIFLENEFNKFISAEYKSAILKSAQIAEKLNTKIYLIGGIVRDLILNNEIKDIDIAVESDAIDFCKQLTKNLDCEIITTQENLRTAKVKFRNGIIIDFASTRKEKYAKSGVLPVAYDFGCQLEEDVKRRDFTINTLVIALTGKEKFLLIDFYNGYNDIRNKQIKILHNNSFVDDPSRIIRALKFKIRFDFSLEENTNYLMQKYLDNVDKTMPLERIKNELRQYFLINKKGLYEYIIATKGYKLIANNPIKQFDEKLIKNNEQKWFIFIILLLINDNYDERLNFNSNEKKILVDIKEMLNMQKPTNNFEIYNSYIDKTDLSLEIYYLITQDETVKKFLSVLKEIRVLITGKELIDLGFIPSPFFNELFKKILKEKLDGRLQNKEEEIEFVKQFIQKEE